MIGNGGTEIRVAVFVVDDLIGMMKKTIEIAEQSSQVIVVQATYHEEAKNYVVRVDYVKGEMIDG